MELVEEEVVDEKVAKAEAKAIRKQGTIKVSGKDYLQVASRILLFRRQHPEASIRTGYESFPAANDGVTVVATCQVIENNNVLAIAHKTVKFGVTKGPGKDWPFEMAETESTTPSNFMKTS